MVCSIFRMLITASLLICLLMAPVKAAPPVILAPAELHVPFLQEICTSIYIAHNDHGGLYRVKLSSTLPTFSLSQAGRQVIPGAQIQPRVSEGFFIGDGDIDMDSEFNTYLVKANMALTPLQVFGSSNPAEGNITITVTDLNPEGPNPQPTAEVTIFVKIGPSSDSPGPTEECGSRILLPVRLSAQGKAPPARLIAIATGSDQDVDQLTLDAVTKRKAADLWKRAARVLIVDGIPAGSAAVVAGAVSLTPLYLSMVGAANLGWYPDEVISYGQGFVAEGKLKVVDTLRKESSFNLNGAINSQATSVSASIVRMPDNTTVLYALNVGSQVVLSAKFSAFVSYLNPATNQNITTTSLNATMLDFLAQHSVQAMLSGSFATNSALVISYSPFTLGMLSLIALLSSVYFW